MKYRIKVHVIPDTPGMGATKVYEQTFDYLNVGTLITKLNMDVVVVTPPQPEPLPLSVKSRPKSTFDEDVPF